MKVTNRNGTILRGSIILSFFELIRCQSSIITATAITTAISSTETTSRVYTPNLTALSPSKIQLIKNVLDANANLTWVIFLLFQVALYLVHSRSALVLWIETRPRPHRTPRNDLNALPKKTLLVAQRVTNDGATHDRDVNEQCTNVHSPTMNRWEIGTHAQALIEFDYPTLSVFSPSAIPVPSFPYPQSVNNIAARILATKPPGILPLALDGSSADPGKS
jgi:hypothetical protein